MYGGDEVGAIVIDVGSSNIKAGWAGEDNPRTVFSSHIGVMFVDDDGKSNENNTTGSFVGSNLSTDVDAAQDRDTTIPRTSMLAPPSSWTSSSSSNSSSSSSSAIDTRRRKLFIGDTVHRRDHMDMISPVQHGLIMDWEAYDKYLDYIFKTQLHADVEEAPLLLSEPVLNTKARREKTVEIVFEKHRTPAVYLAKDAVLSAFSCGKATATVLDIGAGKTSCVAVNDGYALYKSSKVTKIGGDSLDALTEELLFQSKGIMDIPPKYAYYKKYVEQGTQGQPTTQGTQTAQPQTSQTTPIGPGPMTGTSLVYEALSFPLTTRSYRHYAQAQIVRDAKETICRVHDQAFDAELYAKIPSRPYVLPDGTVLEVGVERMLVGESLFQPSLGLGKEVLSDFDPLFKFEGMHKLLCRTVDMCDPDIRKDLYSNIVLVGGGSIMRDFQARLHKEVDVLLPMGLRSKIVNGGTMTERQYAAWLGGSILSSLGTFHQLWFSRQEYEEHGSSILLRKCP